MGIAVELLIRVDGILAKRSVRGQIQMVAAEHGVIGFVSCKRARSCFSMAL